MREWTPAEADERLPELTELVEKLRSRRTATDAAPSGNGHRPPRRVPDEELGAALARLDDEGIVLRDVPRGLLDFPARSPSGRPYFLCWVVGEPAVAWWHWPEDGFAGRTPLSTPPE